MFLDYTEEQALIKEMSADFAAREVAPLADEYDFSRSLTAEEIKSIWKKLTPAVMKIAGGFDFSDIDYVSLGIAAEEVFKVNPDLACTLGISVAPAGMVQMFGSAEQKRRFVPPIIGGDKIGCFAITEPDVGSNPAEIETTALEHNSHYVLNGTKTWISNGHVSDLAAVICRVKGASGSRIGILLVDRAESPYESSELPHVGLKGFPTSELYFSDCEVPSENLLGGGGNGGPNRPSGDLKFVLQGFEIMRTLMAVGAVAMAQAALDHAVTYAKQRRQWGKLIGEHQMIQEMICDMTTSVDCARLLTYRALSLLQQGKRCDRETSMAKWFATEMAVEVTSKAIQIHGANGLSEEFPLAKLFRDARMFTIPDGTTQIQKLIVSRDVLGLSAF